MDKDELSQLVGDVVGELLETHLASVHEEIADLRSELNEFKTEVKEDFEAVSKDMRDGFAGLKSEIGGVHNRIDNETFARKDLEHRIRKVLPDLPHPTQAK